MVLISLNMIIIEHKTWFNSIVEYLYLHLKQILVKKYLLSLLGIIIISCGGSDDVDENIAAIDPIIGAWSIEVEST